MERLDIPDQDVGLADLARSSSQNFRAIQVGVDRLGVNLLRSIVNRTTTAVSGSVDVALTDFQTSVRTSGGAVCVHATIPAVANTTGQALYLKLYVDDVLTRTVLASLPATGAASLAITWIGDLSVGQHTFKLYANGVDSTFGNANADSFMHVVEFLKG